MAETVRKFVDEITVAGRPPIQPQQYVRSSCEPDKTGSCFKIQHNFNTADVVVQLYTQDGEMIKQCDPAPSGYTIKCEANSVSIEFVGTLKPGQILKVVVIG